MYGIHLPALHLHDVFLMVNLVGKCTSPMDSMGYKIICSLTLDIILILVHITHTIHVWHIDLHLVDFYGKCR